MYLESSIYRDKDVGFVAQVCALVRLRQRVRLEQHESLRDTTQKGRRCHHEISRCLLPQLVEKLQQRRRQRRRAQLRAQLSRGVGATKVGYHVARSRQSRLHRLQQERCRVELVPETQAQMVGTHCALLSSARLERRECNHRFGRHNRQRLQEYCSESFVTFARCSCAQ